MNKRTILLTGAAIITLIIVVLTWLYYSGIDQDNFSDNDNLTASQKRDAIITALTGSDMGSKMLWNPGSFQIGPVAISGSGWYNGLTGYINTTGLLAQVPVTLDKGAPWYTDRYLIFVNLSGHSVTGTLFADAHHYPASAHVSIPAGAGWYHELGTVNPNTMSFQVEYDGGPVIMPAILDRENLQKAVNGESYRAINVSLTVVPGQNMVNGKIHDSKVLYMLIKNPYPANTTKINVLFYPPF